MRCNVLDARRTTRFFKTFIFIPLLYAGNLRIDVVYKRRSRDP